MKILDKYSRCLVRDTKCEPPEYKLEALWAGSDYWELGHCTAYITGRASVTSKLDIPGDGKDTALHKPTEPRCPTQISVEFVPGFPKVNETSPRT
jgi:hypothetical protein